MVFLNYDLNQVENRICLMLTRDPHMIELARTPSYVLDMHTLNVEIIFGKERLAQLGPAERKEYRQIGKKTNHGFQRGMSAPRLSDSILKDMGLFVPVIECARHLDAIRKYYAPVEHVYFKDIRHQVVKYRMLCNTWGRILRFTWDHLDDDGVFREAYSFPLQSEAADLLNQWGFKPLYYWLKKHKPWCHINLQVHDSITLSCRPTDVWEITKFVRSKLERPRIYYGNALTVPVDFSIGSNWNVEHEWKRPPTQAQMEGAAWECEAKAQGLRLEEQGCSELT